MDDILDRLQGMKAKDWAIDVAIAAAAFVVACVQLMLTVSSIVFPDLALRQYLGLVNVVPEFGVFVALALTTLPLVLRRVAPWLVFAVVLVLHCSLQSLYASLGLSPIGLLIALFTVAAQRTIAEAAAAALLAIGGLLLFSGSSATPSLAFFLQVQNIGLVVAAVAAGYGFKTHQAYVRATEERAAEAERTREEEAARRVEEERVRIAREVHDITAHSLSAVSVQTAAAERLLDRDPAAAKEAIEAARSTAKSALDDIRSMIGVLRHGDAPAEVAPTEGTDRLSDLVRYLEDAGVACRLDTVGYERGAVPAHVDLALFAIAREAATNIVKHAQATRAVIRLALANGSAYLTVADNGSGCDVALGDAALPHSQDGSGNGIAGMAERARLLGGALEAGADFAEAFEGGFVVRARMPLATARAQEEERVREEQRMQSTIGAQGQTVRKEGGSYAE